MPKSIDTGAPPGYNHKKGGAENDLDHILSQTKQTEKLKALQNDWKEYAKQVYQNVEIIIDGNASEDFAKDCKKFLQVMSNK